MKIVSFLDRDDFVKVIENNLDPKLVDNFEKYSSNLVDLLDLPYDIGSLMHYAANAFSKNGMVKQYSLVLFGSGESIKSFI